MLHHIARLRAWLSEGVLGKVIVTCGLILVYCLVGVTVFKLAESAEAWSVVDALYFSVVVMSTVGYGDLSPSLPGTRVFTVFYILAGVGVVFPAIAECMGLLSGPIIERGRDWMEKMFPQQGIDINGNGVADFKVPRAWPIYYSKNLAPPLLLNVLVQQVAALLFVMIEGWDYGTASYHCYTTATTVGFGDVGIETQGGQIFAIFHILLSVCLLAAFISDVDSLRSSRQDLLQRAAMLQRRLDRDLILSLDQDGLGVEKVEFVIGMLTKLGVVAWADVEPFLRQFQALDRLGDGRLHHGDLEAIAAGYADRVAAAHESGRCDQLAKAKPKDALDFTSVVAADTRDR